MTTIQDLIAQMKDQLELEAFVEQQFTTILDLNKKITELNVEIAGLKTTLATVNQGSLKLPGQDEKTSEQMICEVQLALLNNTSMQRELTAEESKKVETYSKIMNGFRSIKKPEEKPVQKVSTAELLQLVKNDSSQA